MARFLSLWIMLGLLVVAGCGQAKPGPVQGDPHAKVDPPNVEEAPVAKVLSKTGSAELVATASEGTAEATFQQTLVAFQEGRVDAAFDSLPASYQADVEQLVHEFADKMDAELWSTGFQLVDKVSHLLKTKKELILNLDGVKRFPQIDLLKPHWDTIAAGIHDVATSEVANVADLKRADVRRLLISGSQLLSGLPLPKFGDVQVSTVKSDSETATLAYRESKDAEQKQVDFIKIEGKWLPKSIAAGWSPGVADIRKSLAELPQRVSGFKPEAMKQFESIGGMLDQLQAAKTTEQFNAAVAPLVFTIAFGIQMAEQAMRDSGSGSQPKSAVNCVINRELSDAELTALKDAVLASLGESGSQSDYELIPNDGKTRCRFTSVSDTDAMVAVLKKHFDSASIRLDADTKTIYVEIN